MKRYFKGEFNYTNPWCIHWTLLKILELIFDLKKKQKQKISRNEISILFNVLSVSHFFKLRIFITIAIIPLNSSKRKWKNNKDALSLTGSGHVLGVFVIAYENTYFSGTQPLGQWGGFNIESNIFLYGHFGN